MHYILCVRITKDPQHTRKRSAAWYMYIIYTSRRVCRVLHVVKLWINIFESARASLIYPYPRHRRPRTRSPPPRNICECGRFAHTRRIYMFMCVCVCVWVWVCAWVSRDRGWRMTFGGVCALCPGCAIMLLTGPRPMRIDLYFRLPPPTPLRNL